MNLLAAFGTARKVDRKPRPIGQMDAAINAWMMGRADVARERETRMMAADMTNPFEAALVAFK